MQSPMPQRSVCSTRSMCTHAMPATTATATQSTVTVAAATARIAPSKSLVSAGTFRLKVLVNGAGCKVVLRSDSCRLGSLRRCACVQHT